MKVPSQRHMSPNKLKTNMRSIDHEFRREARILKNLNHPNVIKMIQAKISDHDSEPGSRESSKHSSSGDDSPKDSQPPFSRYIVLELGENGDLFDYVITLQEAFSEELVRYYFLQLLSALEYLHIE